LSESEEIIGGVAHCRDDNNDIVPLLFSLHYAICDVMKGSHISDRTTAVFLDNQTMGHDNSHSFQRGTKPAATECDNTPQDMI
jgi:hypothetical protein